MPNKIYTNVLNRLAVEVPLFAESVLNKALAELGVDAETVSAIEMKRAIESYIEPALKRKMGVQKGINELGSGHFSMNEKGEIIFATPICLKLYPNLMERVFGLNEEVASEVVSLGERQLKILVVPYLDENNVVVGGVGIIKDATLMVELDVEVSQAYDRLHDILLSSEDLIWEVDENFVYTYVSGRTKELLGCSTEEVVGKSFFDFVVDENLEKVKKVFAFACQSKDKLRDVEFCYLTKSGEKVCFMMNGVPIVHEGVLRGYRGVTKNVTESKRVFMALVEKKDELERFNNLTVNRELMMIELKQQIARMESIMKNHGIEDVAGA